MKQRMFLFFIGSLLLFSACSNETSNATIQGATSLNNSQNIVTGGCPHNIVNDTFPGSCGLYKDENHNGKCDYGE